MPLGNSRPESQGDSGLKPRVARNEPPWDIATNGETTPTGLRRDRETETRPRWGWKLCGPPPRVARSSQPWAGRHNPFGIAEPLVRSLFGSFVLNFRKALPCGLVSMFPAGGSQAAIADQLATLFIPKTKAERLEAREQRDGLHA